MHGFLSEDHLGFIENFDKFTLDVSIDGGVLEHLS